MATYIAQINSVEKVCNKPYTDLYNYIAESGLIKLCSSKDEEGDICLAWTKLGLITIYQEDNKFYCYHELTTGDIYITEYSVMGYYICGSITSMELPVYSNF